MSGPGSSDRFMYITLPINNGACRAKERGGLLERLGAASRPPPCNPAGVAAPLSARPALRTPFVLAVARAVPAPAFHCTPFLQRARVCPPAWCKPSPWAENAPPRSSLEEGQQRPASSLRQQVRTGCAEHASGRTRTPHGAQRSECCALGWVESIQEAPRAGKVFPFARRPPLAGLGNSPPERE